MKSNFFFMSIHAMRTKTFKSTYNTDCIRVKYSLILLAGEGVTLCHVSVLPNKLNLQGYKQHSVLLYPKVKLKRVRKG